MGCNHASSEGKTSKVSIPDTIDIKDTQLIQALIDNIREEGDSDLNKALDENEIVFFPTIKRHFKSLNPDSIAKVYGAPIYDPHISSFRPSKYNEEYCKRWYTNRQDEVYEDLAESNTIVNTEELTPILSRIDEFKIAEIVWTFKDSIRLEVIYLISDTTLIPIDGWIADKDHFIFRRI